MRLQSNYKQLSHQKRKTKNIDGAVRFLTNTDFNCIQAQFSSVESRMVTLKREDGWLTTNLKKLLMISRSSKSLFSSLQTFILASYRWPFGSDGNAEACQNFCIYLNMFKHVKRNTATLRINFWINCTLLGADNFLPQCKTQTCKLTDPLTQQTRKCNSQRL